ncbi:Autophagy-related protein 13 [Yarrowia sp. C11]|nr:Autophagy-related protein 13 [Yarrowia sp. C11]KAG5364936.1 Autophagy-related protein 13 [Yarrowia sp. E02]
MSFQGTSSGSSHSSKSKLNQVVQNFFSKATQVVVQARLNPRQREQRQSGDKHKLNKWFNLETDELEAYREDLKLWRTIDIYNMDKMPPVVVETYLDMRHLSPNQTLVLEDAYGKRWNASFGGRKTEVVLERWVIEIQRPDAQGGAGVTSPASSTELPMAYKKCILLFRSLYTYCRLLPAWTLQKRLSKSKLSTSPLRIGCRVLNGSQPISSRGRVGLSKLIAGSSESQHLQTFSFDPVEIPSGVFKISVSYRVNCNFAVDDSEAMLSSQFLRIDEEKPVVPPSPPVKHPSMAAPNLHYITGLPRRHSHSQGVSGAAIVPTSVSSVTDYMERRKSSGASGAVGGLLLASTSGSSGGVGYGGSGGSGGSGGWGGEEGSPGPAPNSASPSTPPFPRVPSSSSLAALRIPRRTISNSSTSSNNIARVATTPGYTPSAYEQAISSSGGSSRSGSVPKYSSSFGTRQWNRSGSISSSRRRNSMLVGSAESAISSGSSLMEPGSGFIDIEDPTDVSDFVKMVDSIKPGSPYSLPSPRKGSDPLARFQQLKGSHAGIADSITSSIYHHQPSPPYVRSKLSGEANLEAFSSLPRPVTVPPSPRKLESQMQPISLADQHTSEYQQLQQRASARPQAHSYSERDQLDNSHYKALDRYDLGGAAPRVVGSRYYTEHDRGRGEKRYSVTPLPGLEFDEDDDLLFAMSDMAMGDSGGNPGGNLRS